MISHKIVILCLSICLIQDACSFCFSRRDFDIGFEKIFRYLSKRPTFFGGSGFRRGGYGISGFGRGGFGLGRLVTRCGCRGYKGTGKGVVTATGLLPVVGTTRVCGRVPTVGAVCFKGPVRARASMNFNAKFPKSFVGVCRPVRPCAC